MTSFPPVDRLTASFRPCDFDRIHRAPNEPTGVSQQRSQFSLEPGQIFEGKYRIVRELGRGGFGVIYLAHQTGMDRNVALKILRPDVGDHDPNARARFLREIKIISKLRHPNTVTIHDYGKAANGTIYMVLEYVEGTTLKQLLHRRGAIPVMKALGLARQIARSLDEAHRHDVIHRDLKPANIMLTNLESEADFVKVLDFGIARLRGGRDVDLTQSSVPDGKRALIGTPRYMSPEQVRGDELQPASDLYSLGLILYEMLIGQPAVQGDTSMALISQQISTEPLALDQLNALHPRIQDLLRRATDKNANHRFQSGTQFAEAIDDTARRVGAGQAGSSAGNDFFATGPLPAIGASESSATGLRSDTSPPVESSPSQSGGDQWYQSGFSASDFSSDDDAVADFAPELDEPAPSGASGGGSPSDSSLLFMSTPQDDESRLLGIPSSELPQAPGSERSPFAEDTRQRRPPQTSAEKKQEEKEQQESSVAFGFRVAKICFLGLMATFFVYSAFLVLGALVGWFVDDTLRLLAAGGVGLAIPLFSALGENSQKERLEVVHRLTDRIARVFIGSSIFAAGSIVVICMAVPTHVVTNLHDDPNWMFSAPEQSRLADFNEDLSAAVATVIQKATIDLGWHGVAEPETRTIDDEPEEQLQPIGPPEPTRPGTRPDPQTDEDQPDEQTDDTPAQPRPGEQPDDDDDDYVDW